MKFRHLLRGSLFFMALSLVAQPGFSAKFDWTLKASDCREQIELLEAKLMVLEGTPYRTARGDEWIWVENHPKLKEAWVSPEKTFWGPIYGGGFVKELSQDAAQAICDSMDAEVPSQGDFELLREQMLKPLNSDSWGYVPQLLMLGAYPGDATVHHPYPSGPVVWTSTQVEGSSKFVYFDSYSGEFGSAEPSQFKAGVRCVIKPWKEID